MNRLPSRKYLLETFDYDPHTGVFMRKSNGHVYDKLTGSNRYYEVKIKGVVFKVHRLAYYMHTGEDPAPLMLDHIDRDTTNNRINNLRVASRTLQNLNRSNAVLIEFSGITMCLSDWARKLNISPRTIRWRLRQGWSVEHALSVEPNVGNRVSTP